MDHEHTIGVWNNYENTETVTLNELKKKFKGDVDLHIRLGKEYCSHWSKKDDEEVKKDFNEDWNKYFDFWYNTGLIRFTYCPYCGEKLDWKKMKKEKWEDETDYSKT